MTPDAELSLVLFEAAPQIAHSERQIAERDAIPKKKVEPKAIMKRKHHDWQDHATQRTSELVLRAASRKWLIDNKLKDKVKPFEDSSWDNEDTVIAKCKRCGKCTWGMSFMKRRDWLVVFVSNFSMFL